MAPLLTMTQKEEVRMRMKQWSRRRLSRFLPRQPWRRQRQTQTRSLSRAWILPSTASVYDFPAAPWRNHTYCIDRRRTTRKRNCIGHTKIIVLRSILFSSTGYGNKPNATHHSLNSLKPTTGCFAHIRHSLILLFHSNICFIFLYSIMLLPSSSFAT